MNDVGVENFYIELIELDACNTQDELRKREGELIREYKPDLNKQIAGRTIKEYRDDKAEQIREKDRNRFNRDRDIVLQRKI